MRVLKAITQHIWQQVDIFILCWRGDWRKSAAFSFNNLFYCIYLPTSITKKQMSEQMSNIKYLLYVILLEVMALFGVLMQDFQNEVYSNAIEQSRYVPLKGKRSSLVSLPPDRFSKTLMKYIHHKGVNILSCPHYTQALQICRPFCGNSIKNYLTNGDNGKF